jgi:hypothetical protein
MQPIIAGTSDLRLTDAGRAAVTEEARRALMDRLDVIAARTANKLRRPARLVRASSCAAWAAGCVAETARSSEGFRRDRGCDPQSRAETSPAAADVRAGDGAAAMI